jgi:hypothetical protein
LGFLLKVSSIASIMFFRSLLSTFLHRKHHYLQPFFKNLIIENRLINQCQQKYQ